MLKHAQRDEAIAKPRSEPVSIAAGYARAMERFPKIIARLGE